MNDLIEAEPVGRLIGIHMFHWQGLLGVRLEVFGLCEIERRPRGASRATLAPTFVSGQ
ncbi:hypothetical protein NPS42_15675 [Pseudomonas putida]|uniref:hypothetical protein n=1 Tax=Pseudomonas putida TaxID=303 RepID=UPI002364192E|nr:hypothetical protein [Pseudomonas putida]MDD2027231.1 hypothetical protein [Pseudomonas putida]HDS1766787.1 hypothetical protein [Pseudomonas putida]